MRPNPDGDAASAETSTALSASPPPAPPPPSEAAATRARYLKKVLPRFPGHPVTGELEGVGLERFPERGAAPPRAASESEWVRRALREARRREPRGGLESKLRAVRRTVQHEGPTGDIDQVLAEIERGYAAPPPE